MLQLQAQRFILKPHAFQLFFDLPLRLVELLLPFLLLLKLLLQLLQLLLLKLLLSIAALTQGGAGQTVAGVGGLRNNGCRESGEQQREKGISDHESARG